MPPAFGYLLSDTDRAIVIALDKVMFVECQSNMQKSEGRYYSHGANGSAAIVIGYVGNMEKVFKYESSEKCFADFKNFIEKWLGMKAGETPGPGSKDLAKIEG